MSATTYDFAVSDLWEQFHENRYALFAFIIMPNHVHVVLKPFEEHSLENTLASWKKFTSRRINESLNQQGNLWQDESYDRIARDNDHIRRILEYLETNANQIERRRVPWINSTWKTWLVNP